MPVTAIDQPAHLIIDNSFVADLTNCFCKQNSAALPRERILAPLRDWLIDKLNALRPSAIDNILHTTNVVANEYRPHGEGSELGKHAGLTFAQIDQFAIHVRTQFRQYDATNQTNRIRLLRFGNAPKKLIGAGGLSNNDLSLVLLGLELTKTNTNVILLSNDQDLLSYAAWVNTYKASIDADQNPKKLFSLRGLTFLDLVHRSCLISSDQMKAMIDHSFLDIFARLPGTDKGMDILKQIMEVRDRFDESRRIKIQNQEARA